MMTNLTTNSKAKLVLTSLYQVINEKLRTRECPKLLVELHYYEEIE